jgi:SNF2 family DNA or RNA helicase
MSKAPSNWDTVKKIRKSKTASLKPSIYLKPETNLRYYQTVGVLNALLTKRMILGDGAGLGKTLQMITAYAVLKEKQPQWKLLVVAQKSSMEQWGEEFDKFTKGLSYHVLKKNYKPEGASRQLSGFKARKAQYDEKKDVDVLVVGYHAVKEDYKFLIENRGDTFMVVYDECQEFKNHKTQAFHGAEEIASRASRVYGLTATPIKNRLVEFYYILKVIVPGLFPKITKFKDIYTKQELKMIPSKGGPKYMKQIVGYKNLLDFKTTIEPYFLIRRTADVSDELPKIISKKISVEMTAPQRKLYAEALSGVVYKKKLQEKYFTALEKFEMLDDPTDRQETDMEELKERYELSLSKDGNVNAKAASLTYCQLIANGPEWIDETGKSEKEEEFKRQLEGELADQKMIVFTRFATGIPRLEKICKDLGIGTTRITGAEDGDQRTKNRLKFQDPDSGVDVIFITYAGSAGINLQKAGLLMFFDTPWSFGDLYQIIGRAQRLGSEHKNVIVMHMITEGTVDEHVLEILEGKKKLNDQILGDIAEGSLEFSKEDEVDLGYEEGEVDALYRSVFG